MATLQSNVGKEHIHAVTMYSDIKKILAQIWEKSPHPHLFRGYIDAGGGLQVCPPNVITAKAICEFLQEEQKKGKVDPDLHSVLFFHNNVLHRWKMGAASYDKIGSTTPVALKAKGLEPKNYFVLYDDTHTTGTDILLLPNARSLVYYNPTLLQCRELQAGMRPRQLLFSQNNEIVVDKATLIELFNKGGTIYDLTLLTSKNQTIRKALDMPRYFKGHIGATFRFFAEEEMVAAFLDKPWHDNSFITLMNKVKPYIAEHADDNLRPFARVSKQALCKPNLKNRLNKLANDFPFPSPQLTSEVQKLTKHIDRAPLPTYMETTADLLGTENEIEAAVEVDINVEQEQQKEVEIDELTQTELQLYENVEPTDYLPDRPITYNDFLQLIETLRSPKPTLTTLSQQLKKYKYGLKGKPKAYDKIFSQPIYGTERYFYACTTTLPVFHRLQRPPTQIVAIKTGSEFRWLLVSERQGNSILHHLKGHPELNGVWLIQPDGSPLSSTKNPFPYSNTDPKLLQGLVEINIFNGNADWLGYYEHYLSPWLVGDFDLKLDFLKLRTARHPHQRTILAYLPSILKMTNSSLHSDLKTNHMLFSERTERELRKLEGNFVPEGAAATKLLAKMEDIERLAAHCVPDLGIDPRKNDPATVEALKRLRADHLIANDEEIRRICQDHSIQQFKYLPDSKIPSIIFDQIQWLHESKIAHLKHPSQIMRKIGDKTEYAIEEKHIQHLDPTQDHLVPAINPNLYRLLTHKAHIENIPNDHVDKINPKYALFLKPDQIKEGIKTKEVLETLKAHFLPTEWQHLNGNFIPQIPPDFVTEQHIQQITAPNLVKELYALAQTDERRKIWGPWLGASQVPSLDPAFIPHLTHKDQVQAVNPTDLDKISDLYKSQISNTQVTQGIRTNALFQAYKPYLQEAHWSHVSSAFIKAIPPDKVRENHIQSLEKADVIEELDVTYFTKYMGWLQPTQIPTLNNPKLIRAFSFWKALCHLSPIQLKHRTRFQNIVHIVALYLLGFIAKMALAIPCISFFSKLIPPCQRLSSQLTKYILNTLH